MKLIPISHILLAIVMVVPVACVQGNSARIGNQPVEDHGIEQSPLLAAVEAHIREHPDNAYPLYGPCGNPAAAAESAFQEIINGAPPEQIIPLLAHRAPHLRNVVHRRLLEMGDAAMPAITEAFENGSARIRLALQTYVDPDATDQDRFELLEEIIHNEEISVFAEDLELVNPAGVQPRYGSIADYPVDILTYHLRLMREDDYASHRARSARLLGLFGEEAVEAVPAIIDLLEEEDAYVSNWGSVWAGGIGSRCLRGAAAIALGDIGPAASEAIPALEQAHTDPDKYVRLCAASSLYLIGHKPDDQVRYLVDRLQNEPTDDMNMRLVGGIADHLGRIGPDASTAIPRLIELTRHEHHWVNMPARNAISAIEESQDRVVQLLTVQLQSGDEERRRDAIYALSYLWDADISQAVPILVAALDDVRGYEIYELCNLLIRTGGYDEEITSAITRQIEERGEQHQQCAVLLIRMGPAARGAIPALEGLIEDPSGVGLSTGASVYAAIGGDTDWLVQALILQLYADNTHHNTTQVAIRALRDLGPQAAAALPDLRALAETSDERTRGYAEEAIAAIEGTEEENPSESE